MTGRDEFAFPRPDERGPNGEGIMQGSHGMTLRDWFAGQALSAMNGAAYPAEKAKQAYAIADAMLHHRQIDE